MARIIKCDLCTAQGDEVTFRFELTSYQENKSIMLDVCKVDAEKIMKDLRLEFREVRTPGGAQTLTPAGSGNAKPAKVVSQ